MALWVYSCDTVMFLHWMEWSPDSLGKYCVLKFSGSLSAILIALFWMVCQSLNWLVGRLWSRLVWCDEWSCCMTSGNALCLCSLNALRWSLGSFFFQIVDVGGLCHVSLACHGCLWRIWEGYCTEGEFDGWFTSFAAIKSKECWTSSSSFLRLETLQNNNCDKGQTVADLSKNGARRLNDVEKMPTT